MRQYLYLSLDGVLCDTMGAALERLEVGPEFSWPDGVRDLHTAVGMPYGEVWSRLGDHQFWANIGMSAEASLFIAAAEHLAKLEDVYLVSKPTRSPASASGKLAWVWSNLPYYAEEGRFILATNKQRLARSGDILVDDCPKAIAQWEAAGGVGVLVPRPWNYRHAEEPAVAVQELAEVVEKPRYSSMKGKKVSR